MVYAKFISALLVCFAIINQGKTQFRWNSCSIQCGHGSDTTLPGSAAVTYQGPPGKRGPRGFKGSKGEPAEQCNCETIHGLATKIQKLQLELNKAKSKATVYYNRRHILWYFWDHHALLTGNAAIARTYALHLQTQLKYFLHFLARSLVLSLFNAHHCFLSAKSSSCPSNVLLRWKQSDKNWFQFYGVEAKLSFTVTNSRSCSKFLFCSSHKHWIHYFVRRFDL